MSESKDLPFSEDVPDDDVEENSAIEDDGPYSDDYISLDDLKNTALSHCMDVYDDFDATEIGAKEESVRRCWEIGKAVYEFDQRKRAVTR